MVFAAAARQFAESAQSMLRLTLASVESASEIAAADWLRLCPGGDPFVNRAFFTLLEAHGAAGPDWGWRASHLVARDESARVVGILPLYLKSNSFGDFIHDWNWAAAFAQFGHRYYPKLLTGLPHTPAAGPRLLVLPGADAAMIRHRLIDAGKSLLADYGLSSWHVVMPAADELELLRAAGCVVSEDVQFHWHDAGFCDFAGFLAAFSADKRRKVRAERRRAESAGLAIEVRHGDEIDRAEWPALHALYASTFAKFDNHAVFTADCFADLAVALGRRMVVFSASDRGTPVAMSLCFRSDEVLYGRYWGCRGDYDSLHFELCFYRGIDYCLRQGLRRFEPGAGGEHKIARGFKPSIVRSAHWIGDTKMRAMIGQHLERHRQLLGRYRDEAAGHLPFRRDGGAVSASD